MKKLLLIVCLLVVAIFAQAQEKCLTEINFRKYAAENPTLLQNREQLERFTEQYLKDNANKVKKRSSSTVASYIIPVVVHVIHYGGTENISKEQIEDQIRILDEDFRRLNADTINTPTDFLPLAADSDIEFRLAQLDPQGNCTDGIVRVYSNLTFNARDNVKALSYWPSNKYLNMWIVASIANSSGSPGDVIGFAQFPGGAAATDGIVIKHDYMGSIGTASNTGNAGRTTTHEVGHWLNLRHIWGDDAGACTGSDNVPDTPNQANWTLSICPSFPLTDACTANSPGILYPDYMDYTNGDCQNVFTFGQASRMQAALNSALSGRNNLWSSSNLIATGTNGTPAVLCVPKADFIPRPVFICEGGSFTFKDGSYNGTVDSRVWTFPGGTPATDTSANPTVTYATAGVYDVTLDVTNTAGTSTKTLSGLVTVSAPTNTGNVPYSEGFETGTFPFNDWYILNSNGGNTWALSSLAGFASSKSLRLNNFSGNDKGSDEFILPAINLSNVSGTSLTFDMAYAISSTTASNTDKLSVFVSTNCGQTWTLRRGITGTTFPTVATAITSSFVPNQAQWRNETVSFSPTSISGKPNVRVRFDFTHDTGNNIYIDNININGTVTGLDEVQNLEDNVNVYPNPSPDVTYVDFSTKSQGIVVIELRDVSGRVVSTFSDEMSAGDHQYTINEKLESGIYMLNIIVGNQTTTKRVVIQK